PQRPVMTADTPDIFIDTNPTLEVVDEAVPEPVAQDQVTQTADAPDAAPVDDNPSAQTVVTLPAATPSTPVAEATAPASASPSPASAASATASLDRTGL